ncbi:hypothetical protein [Streptacidiphilus albus]|uniref:hypothetical protein n=1 Tax=Streptacidiphilus albus TaxID=105425 RepID=UPI00054B7198|nr:hypothetical protein [Streptacidiphilus albus]
MQTGLEASAKDWAAFQAQAVAFYLKNAAAWGNQAASEDLAVPVDPDFRPGPAALDAARAAC